MIRLSVVVAGFVGALLLSSCGLIKNMQEMHDDTHKVSATSDQLSSTTDNVLETSQNMFDGLRPVNALTSRKDRLRDMVSVDVGVDKKMGDAGAYYESFEFQSWSGEGRDDQQRRADLMDDAVDEYFQDLYQFLGGKDVEKMSTAPDSTDKDIQNLLALAAAMHKVFRNQIFYGNKNHFTPISMLDVIEDGLSKGRDERSGKVTPNSLVPYQHRVLTFELEAIYLLQLRVNVLAGFALNMLTGIEIQNIGKTALEFIDAKFFKGNFPVSRLSKLNPSVLYKLTQAMQGANDVRDFLVSIGRSPRIDSNLLFVFKHLQSVDAAAKNARLDASSLQAQIDRFVNSN